MRPRRSRIDLGRTGQGDGTVDLSDAAAITGAPCAGAVNPVSSVTIGSAALDRIDVMP
jgi:hypothetical protein